MSKENDIEEYGIEESAGYKNIIAIRDYTKATRQMIRELENEVKTLKNLILEQKTQLDQKGEQIQALQIKLYSGGATTA
jgi:hypothetical protein